MGMKSEIVGFDTSFDIGAQIMHEGPERVCWPAREALVKGANDKLDVVVILPDGLSNCFALDCGDLTDLI